MKKQQQTNHQNETKKEDKIKIEEKECSKKSGLMGEGTGLIPGSNYMIYSAF